MLKNKRSRKAWWALVLCVVLGTCAAAPKMTPENAPGKMPAAAPEGAPGMAPAATPEGVSERTPGMVSEGAPVQKTEEKTSEQTGVTGGLTIQKEDASKTLYTEALGLSQNETQKYTTVRRGDFITTVTESGTVIYPEQKRIKYEFPYGITYFLESVEIDSPIKQSGDPIAKIYVAIDEIELAQRERRLQRMEERGETGSSYEELKKTLQEMQEALTMTEIVMKEDGVLLEQEHLRFGTRINSYEIVVADPKERLIEVSNENKYFRYGQEVKVSAKIDGVTKTGAGTVITASANTVSEELAGNTAYIRLDEESEYLYAGTGINVTVETVHVENVLLLDVSATYMDNGMQMVKVKDEYGLHAVTFSFGRKNSSVYWVIDGLEEGTEILVQ